MKRLLPCAVATAAALVAHHIAGRALAARDIVQAVLAGDYLSIGALALVLLAARLFLYLLAPGWVLQAGDDLRGAAQGEGSALSLQSSRLASTAPMKWNEP